jgi:hypothetical protein
MWSLFHEKKKFDGKIKICIDDKAKEDKKL